MKRTGWGLALMVILAAVLTMPVHAGADDAVAEAASKPLIYDDAGLLDEQEYDELNAMANEYSAGRETDFIIVTSDNEDNIDVMRMTQDFYDAQAPGYDKPHGNAVILTVDMRNREVYLAGFYKAEQYLDGGRLDKIRDRIIPHIADGDYALAFQDYYETAYRYMGFRPGVNPDNILFRLWFQAAASLVVAGAIVGVMAYRSGGRVTVTRRTYEDAGTSKIVGQRDQYLRTTVSRRKINKNNGGGGGSGGGMTRGGHSHSGSRGSF